MNASKGNANTSSHEIAKTMLHSVVARRMELIELAGGLDASMVIPDGGGGTSICELLARAIPTSIPTRLTKISVAMHMVDMSLPENWPFDTMVTRTRTRAMKRMTDKSITDSARKKACMVRTALANNVETYVSIVRDMIPGSPASQEILEVCLTQASLEAKK